MANNRPLVTIKGKKDGLVLKLDDQCSYHQLIQELKARLAERHAHYQEGPLVSVKVEAGDRFLNQQQKEEIEDIIRSENKLFVAELSSNVISKDDCARLLRQERLRPLKQMVRSGQVLQSDGDLLLIGDVNPGGKVIAKGSIYILGALKGMVHAGSDGSEDKVVVASHFKPTQLIIGDCVGDANELFPDGKGFQMACAFITQDTKTLTVSRLQALVKQTPADRLMAAEGVNHVWEKQ
ncbi:septum site-determining protein MinC [Camelliibacillus cellulosilyticus]|uniref:Probable septum site-determining protein MinC n=1 Tax=Camelliibacillus cellulosilyticus TaxID=2174486 RepID=A0ABV9GJB6_9BACL